MTALALVPKLRRMVAEPTNTPYTDAILADEYIEIYPVPDSKKNDPDSDEWTPTYDLHSAAMDIWEEKAATVAARFDYTADGGSYHEDQRWQHCKKMASYHGARRRAQNRSLTKDVYSVSI